MVLEGVGVGYSALARLPIDPPCRASCQSICMPHDEELCEEDAEALRARRADLHAFMEEIAVAAAKSSDPHLRPDISEVQDVRDQTPEQPDRSQEIAPRPPLRGPPSP